MASKRPVLWPTDVINATAASFMVPSIRSANASALAWSISRVVMIISFCAWLFRLLRCRCF